MVIEKSIFYNPKFQIYPSKDTRFEETQDTINKIIQADYFNDPQTVKMHLHLIEKHKGNLDNIRDGVSMSLLVRGQEVPT